MSMPMPTPQVQPLQIQPLSITGSGSKTNTGIELARQNEQLGMMFAQAQANTVYDPKVPASPTQQKFVEKFTNQYGSSTALTLAVSGILLIVYGLVVE